MPRLTFYLFWLMPIFASSVSAHAAQPTQPHRFATVPEDNEAPLLKSTDPGAQRFKPVGKLKAYSANCTATLIAGAHTPVPTKRALVLTAGHCAGHFNANTVIVDRAAGSNWTFTPDYFIDTQSSQHHFDVSKILYATMKGVDLAVLQLDATYGELAALGIQPMTLYAATPLPTTPIETAHIPVRDVSDPAEQFMRLSACYADIGRPTFEGDDPWLWNHAVPNFCKGIAGGSSGSPVVLKDSAEVIGVINTVVDTDQIGCGENRPCELQGTGSLPREGAAYYIPIDPIAQALTADSDLDLSQLDPGTGATLTRVGSEWSTQSWSNQNDTLRPAHWNLQIGEGTEQIRYKTGLASTTDCSDLNGYGPALDSADQPLMSLAVPSDEGIYKLCAIGKASEEDTWQDPKDATVMLHQIDDTPPVVTPYVNILGQGDDAWLVKGWPRAYEIRGGSLLIKYGPKASTDCSDFAGYVINALIPVGVVLKKSEAPWRVCLRGFDLAGNAAPLYFEDFEH